MKHLLISLSFLSIPSFFSQVDSLTLATADVYSSDYDYEMEWLREFLPELFIEPERTFLDSLYELSREDQILHFKNGGDPNEVISTESGDYSIFRGLAHGYGFWGVDEDKELVFAMIDAAKAPIVDPFFFLEDPDFDRKKDVFEYFAKLNADNQKLDIEDFRALLFYLGPGKEGINYLSDEGKNVMMYAAQLNFMPEVARTVDQVQNIDHADNSGMTALAYAFKNRSLEIMSLLIKNGANPSIQLPSGTTLLMDACARDDREMALFLVKNNVDPKLKNSEGVNAYKACVSKETRRAIRKCLK